MIDAHHFKAIMQRNSRGSFVHMNRAAGNARANE
jgi:hypothetical protein